MRNSMLIFIVWSICSVSAAAQDICPSMFKLGYYDEKSTFTTQQQFSYVQNLLHSEKEMTYQQASDSGFNLGINVIGVMDAALGGKTDSTSFERRKEEFLSYNLSTSSMSSTLITVTKTVSTAVTQAMVKCWELHPSFSVAVTPKVHWMVFQ